MSEHAPGATVQAEPGATERLRARWRALPRAARWGIFAAAGIGAYFLIVEPLMESTASLSAKADNAARQLREYDRQKAARTEALAQIALGASAFGEVAVPSKDSRLVNQVQNQITRLLGDHGVTEYNLQQLRGNALGRGVLTGLIKPEAEELQRVQITVTLTDKTSTVLSVIADLERIPEISAFGQTQLRRLDKTKDRVQATVTPEVWVVVSREGAR